MSDWRDVFDAPADGPPPFSAEAYKERVREALEGFRPTARHQLEAERHAAKERRRAEGRKAPVDYLRKTIDELERRGYMCERTERYDAALKRRFDLFGCVDLIAVGHGRTIAVQATSWDNTASRAAKMRASRILGRALECGWTAVVFGWRKGASGRYEHKEVQIGAEGQ